MTRLVLGIATDHPDSSAALVGEDGILAAIAEERLNRKKHCAGFPALAIAEVLRIAGAELGDVTDIAVARDPMANLAPKAAFLARHPQRAGRLMLRRVAVHRQVRSTLDRIAGELGVDRASIRAPLH